MAEPKPKKRVWLVVLLAFLALLALGSGGVVLAWKTTCLDRWLPLSIRDYFGRVAPTLSGIEVKEITETTATIAWQTDKPATTQVESGADTNYGSQTEEDPNLATFHSVTLTNLLRGTTYHFRVKSKDKNNNLATSEDQTFQTLDLTTDWEVFSNASLGFSVKYPPDWIYEFGEDSIVFIPSGSADTITVGIAIGLLDEEKPTEQSLREYAEDTFAKLIGSSWEEQFGTETQWEELRYGDLTWLRALTADGSGGAYLTVKGTKVYAAEALYSQERERIERILTTFQ